MHEQLCYNPCRFTYRLSLVRSYPLGASPNPQSPQHAHMPRQPLPKRCTVHCRGAPFILEGTQSYADRCPGALVQRSELSPVAAYCCQPRPEQSSDSSPSAFARLSPADAHCRAQLTIHSVFVLFYGVVYFPFNARQQRQKFRCAPPVCVPLLLGASALGTFCTYLWRVACQK